MFAARHVSRTLVRSVRSLPCDLNGMVRRQSPAFLRVSTFPLSQLSSIRLHSTSNTDGTVLTETTGEKRTREAKAHFDQALKHHNGSDGFEKSPELAFESFKKAADLGLVGAQTNVAVCYSHGLGVERDPEAATIYYRLGAAQGDAVCHYSLGVLRTNSGDHDKAFQNFKAAAEKGYPPAIYGLGEMYFNGLGTDRSLVEAVKMYRLGVKHDDVNCMYKLGLCWYDGLGVVSDYSEAFGLFLRASERNHVLAMCSLGSCYEDGVGVARSPILAFKYYKLSADAGYAVAQFNTHVCLSTGVGVDADRAEALHYCRLAADQGHAQAQYNIGLHLAGTGVAADAAEARRYMVQAAEQGVTQAQLAMGLLLSDGSGALAADRPTAARWFLKAADQGNPTAQLRVGQCYVTGDGVARDFALAEKYLTQAALQGEAKAHLAMGLMFWDQEEVRDVKRAFEYFSVAADAGLAEAQACLGTCYAMGAGVAMDVVLAAKYHRQAAEQGHCDAQFLLGEALLLGRGVDQNEAAGLKYVQQAADQDFAPACYLLGLMSATGSTQAVGGSAVHGSAFPPDPVTAVKYLRRAANKNHGAACGALALCYLNGDAGVEQNMKEAARYFELGAEQGDPISQFHLGVGLISEKFGPRDPKRGSMLILMAAKDGFADACEYVGGCFLHGSGFMDEGGGPTTKNPQMAVKFFRRAAENKHAVAMYNLGLCLIKGVGVASDYTEAVHFLKLSAEHKCPQAAHELGILYRNGFGVTTNQEEAIKFFTIAADMNFANSQFALGVSYVMGTGVGKDMKKGKELIQKAADQGQPDALKAIKLL